MFRTGFSSFSLSSRDRKRYKLDKVHLGASWISSAPLAQTTRPPRRQAGAALVHMYSTRGIQEHHMIRLEFGATGHPLPYHTRVEAQA